MLTYLHAIQIGVLLFFIFFLISLNTLYDCSIPKIRPCPSVAFFRQFFFCALYCLCLCNDYLSPTRCSAGSPDDGA
jgi:hypothetical protein